jgi:UDP-hydrolysing UDP-N-acetyl-D-glucosamine 2-epimerase
MPTPRRIAVVTGTRAESGLLQPVMRAIDHHPGLTLQCVAAGMHFVNDTWRQIGFPIAARVRMQRAGQTGRHADAAALGRGVSVFAEAFAALSPDVVVILGDRIEAFAAASAASVGGVRVAHIHGGDRAEGVADEAMRHAITKLAHVHLPATAQSRRRIVRMGEDPAAVFLVGSPAVDGLPEIAPAGPTDAAQAIVLQHPVGEDDAIEAARMKRILQATRRFTSRLILHPNHDPGREGVMSAIETHQRRRGDRVVDHLPRRDFVARLKACRVLVGNSSAGLIEAAVCRTPVVNVGRRQGGRQTPGNVVSCGDQTNELHHAIDEALQLNRSRLRHPYGRGDAGPRIAEVLATFDPQRIGLRKQNGY